MPAPTDTATGLKVEIEGKDAQSTSEVHPDHAYVRMRYGSIYENGVDGQTYTSPTADRIGNTDQDGGGANIAGPLDGVTADVLLGSLTVAEPGVYLCCAEGILVGTGDGDLHTLSLSVDTVAETGEGALALAASISDLAEPARFAISSFLTLTAGQAVGCLLTNSAANSVLHNYRISVLQVASTQYTKPL